MFFLGDVQCSRTAIHAFNSNVQNHSPVSDQRRSERKSGMSAFYYVGLLCSVYAAVQMLRYLSTLVRRGLKVEELGDWALVTGATDGIGKAFVKAGIYVLHSNNSFNIISPIGEIKLCVCQGREMKDTICPKSSDTLYIVCILYKTGHYFLDKQYSFSISIPFELKS